MTIQDWIDALLSGKYPQTKHHLRDINGFCCLGVACDVKSVSQWNYIGSNLYGWGDSSYKETHALPTSLQTELDLDDDFVDELAQMNDFGSTFAEIAERIKEYAEEKQKKQRGAQTC